MQKETPVNTTVTRPVAKPTLRPTSIDEEIHNRKMVVVLTAVFVVLAALPLLYFTNSIVPGEMAVMAILPAAVVYLVLGTLFTVLLTTKFQFLYQAGYNPLIGYTAIVLVLTVAAIAGTSYVKGSFSIAGTLLYGSLFILPFTILQAWLFYKAIATPPEFIIWYLPPPGTATVATTVFLNSIRLQIRLASLPGETENVYEAVVPGRLTVGEMFSFFLKDKQDTEGHQFPFNDILNSNYGWLFFTTSFAGMGLRQLDPDESLLENDIKNNATVIIRRAQLQLAEATGSGQPASKQLQ